MGMSTRTFLLIDVGSMSICTMPAYGANSSIFPVTRSSNRAPMAMRQSVFIIAMLAQKVPCMPSIPIKRGCVPGKPPNPMRVVVVGRPSFVMKLFNSAAASERITPPPAYTTGRLDFMMKSTAFFIWPGCPL